MRKYQLLLFIAIFSFANIVTAQSPPFSKITISGTTNEIFDKVSLFESGGSNKPIKTENVSSAGGSYSISVNIPEDMRQKKDYYFTDMRFWQDKNSNGIRDAGEYKSKCHFIIWVPESNKVFLQVYKGPEYEIKSTFFEYKFE